MALKATERPVANMWKVIDGQLQGREFIEADQFTLADLVLAIYARRWYGILEEIIVRRCPMSRIGIVEWASVRASGYISMPLT